MILPPIEKRKPSFASWYKHLLLFLCMGQMSLQHKKRKSVNVGDNKFNSLSDLSSSEIDEEISINRKNPPNMYQELEEDFEDGVEAYDDDSNLPNADNEEEIRNRIHQSQAQMSHLFSQLNEDQKQRFEMFRQHGFPRPTIKRLIQKILGDAGTINVNLIIAVAGIAKVFLGELVEEAVSIKADVNPNEPVSPMHLYEARRRLIKTGVLNNGRRTVNKLF